MSAKEIQIKPIAAKAANELCKRLHYSGKVVPNSQLHFGVYYKGRLEGVMQFGPPINKKGSIKLVHGTRWNGFIELNRMAFSDNLPRFSESRAIGVACRLIKKHYPHIEWILSFSDATQCGDGAIYRASGFYLTDIRQNDALRVNPETGEHMHVIQAHHLKLSKQFRSWKPLAGYQLRYVKLLYPKMESRINFKQIPFSKINELGIGMYKGNAIQR